ncbi:MAG: class I SAM-dependent RNA methyltransferase [Methyloligellaceae bacterium]
MTAVVETLDGTGDGLVSLNDERVSVAGTLPGETIELRRKDDTFQLHRIINPSVDRVDLACRHFGACGGCKLQHMEQTAYLAWKVDRVARCLQEQGLETDVRLCLAIDPGSRRRARFSARRSKKGVQFGYHGFRDSQIVAIGNCPILVPEIENYLSDIATLVAPLLSRRKEAKITVLSASNGLDIALEDPIDRLDERARALDMTLAEKIGAIRLSAAGELLFKLVDPVLEFDNITISPTTNHFFQAAKPAEQAMRAIVMEEFKSCSKLLDLFCGCGTFTLPLAVGAAVEGVDGDLAALQTLEKGFSAATGLRKITTTRRDLFRDPFSKQELNRFDGVVFDPPRAGARDQCMRLAQSDVPIILGISCNPNTFARDARLLVEGGYSLDYVQPIDQFLYAPHIELIGRFSRG